MKIIQVLNHFLPQQTAGTEVYTWALSKALKANNVEVKVIIPNYEKSNDEEYAYDGLTVHKYAEPSNVDRSLIMGFREPDGLATFGAYLEKEKPDIVHFHELAGSNGIGISHLRAAKKKGAKVIMTFHLASYTCATGTLMYKGKTPCGGKINAIKCSACYLHKKGLGGTSNILAAVSTILKRLHVDTSKLNHPMGTALGTASIIRRKEEKLHELMELCDHVVCITKWYQQVLHINRVHMNKVSFIEQGLPTAFSENIERLNQKDTPIKLMFLGRISPFKGLHLLIEALVNFSATEIELSIFGNSDGTDYEVQLREKTKGKVNICWKGVLDQDKVQEEMHQHDLLCLCSTFSEMSPLVIQEARAAGLPVLASNAPGNIEQLDHGTNGLIFAMNDLESLKKQLKNIIENPEILIELKKNIQVPHSFSKVAREYDNLYQKLLTE
jgi:glycosyltransferase involved in cell wall biosynthesis